MDPIVHHPFVIPIGGLALSGFGLAVALGFIIGDVIGRRELARRGHDPSPVGPAVGAAVVGFIVGAKVYYALLVGDWGSLFSRGGFVFWGGLLGGVLGAWLLLRARRTSFWRVADVGGPGIAAGYAVGRTGCWAVGDDYGRPWDGPLAVQFPDGAPPSTVANMSREFGVQFPAGTDPSTVVAVHPTQLYEVGMALIMFAILWRYRDHRHAEGWLLGVYAVLAGVERFIVEFFRAKDDRFFGPFSLAQLIAVGIIAAGLAIMYLRRSPGPGRPGIHAAAARARIPAAA